MADDDYESLGDGASFTANAIAGASAGYFEHLAVYPMDLVRTQYQTIRSGCKPRSSNPFLTMSQLFRTEGLRGLFRGSGAVVFGCGPAHALQFTIFELTKEKMQNRNMSYMNGYLNASAVGGGVGAIAHDLWMNPCDVVKQRLQVKGSPYVNMSYASIVSNIYRNEGFRAFYLSFPTQMASNVPFSMTQFYIYDKVQNILNPDRAYSPVSNAVAGALAGGFAAFVTTPLDNIKTCLNTQESLLTTMGPNCNDCPVIDDCKTSSGQRVGGVRQAIRTIIASNQSANPLSPFFRGCMPRTYYYAPGTALSWLAYEFMKTVLNSENGQKTKVVDSIHVMGAGEKLNQRKLIGD